MNKKQLVEFRDEVDKVYRERKALGEFDANSKYMVFLLGNFKHLINHAIATYPKGQNVNPNAKDSKANTRLSPNPPKHGR